MTDFTALLSDYTFRLVALGSALLGIISGVLGSFAVLRKQSLLGDGISHAALAGIVLAFILTQSKNTEILLCGALVSGLVATYLINFIVKKSKLKFDSVLAIILSVFFGFGIVLLTLTQKIPNANQAGLDRFIYGKASTLLERDVMLIAIIGAILLAFVILFWKEFKLLSFDEEYTKLLGFNAKILDNFLLLLIVITIIIGLQTVGVILMSAMLITPAVSARQWTDKLYVMVILSAIFGAVSGIFGTYISSSSDGLPTGPVIVVTVSIIAVFSLLFSHKRGILQAVTRQNCKRKAYLKGKVK